MFRRECPNSYAEKVKLAGVFTYSRGNVAKGALADIAKAHFVSSAAGYPIAVMRTGSHTQALKKLILPSKLEAAILSSMFPIHHFGEQRRVSNNRIKAGLAGVLGGGAGLAAYHKSKGKK